jgi:hypothetical protein
LRGARIAQETGSGSGSGGHGRFIVTLATFVVGIVIASVVFILNAIIEEEIKLAWVANREPILAALRSATSIAMGPLLLLCNFFAIYLAFRHGEGLHRANELYRARATKPWHFSVQGWVCIGAVFLFIVTGQWLVRTYIPPFAAAIRGMTPTPSAPAIPTATYTLEPSSTPAPTPRPTKTPTPTPLGPTETATQTAVGATPTTVAAGSATPTATCVALAYRITGETQAVQRGGQFASGYVGVECLDAKGEKLGETIGLDTLEGTVCLEPGTQRVKLWTGEDGWGYAWWERWSVAHPVPVEAGKAVEFKISKCATPEPKKSDTPTSTAKPTNTQMPPPTRTPTLSGVETYPA